ncbi:MAG: hypothetical protein H8D47_05545 [Planctomycetes bacterium]|nr:hypothetical protein [Planctomycetota bacterium]
MIQCKDCEFCQISPDGKRIFKCDPFINIKEPECIQKWQLIRLDMLLASYHGMLKFQQKMAPLQDKIFMYMKKEIDEMDESDNWKIDDEQDENQNPQNDEKPYNS